MVVRGRDGAAHVLLILDPYGRWSLPKGHVEDGETMRDTALREVREETGLERLELGPGLGTVEWYFRRGETEVHKFCTYFLMHAPTGEARPATEEGIEACAWLPLEEAPERVQYDTAREVVRRAVRALRVEEPPFAL